jgi:drug/metabolite transporter (DMT)-like permease
MFVRSFWGTVGFLCYLFAMKYIPMGLLMILYNTAPFWASVLGYVFLKESLKINEIWAMIVGFFGIIIVALSRT